jgi:hypothetical protein
MQEMHAQEMAKAQEIHAQEMAGAEEKHENVLEGVRGELKETEQQAGVLERGNDQLQR